MLDRRRFAVMEKFSEPAVLDDVAKYRSLSARMKLSTVTGTAY